MKRLHFILPILLGVLVWLGPSQAADQAPWYEIELILFKQGNISSGGGEQWSDDPGSPDFNNPVELIETASLEGEAAQPYMVVPRTEWQLEGPFRSLQRTSHDITPLFHQAWRQPVAPSPKSARPIYLGPMLSRPQEFALKPEFEGLLTISVNRYFHVKLDILLNGVNGEAITRADLATLESPTLGSIRINATRRMRSGELHYIDHPMFGALIQISRIEQPQTEEQADIKTSESAQTPATDTPTAAATDDESATTADSEPTAPSESGVPE